MKKQHLLVPLLVAVAWLGSCGIPSATLTDGGSGADTPPHGDASIDGPAGMAILTGTPDGTSPIALGDVAVGATSAPATFVIKNTGDGTSGTIAIAFAPSNLGFAISTDPTTSDSCSGKTLAAGAMCAFSVTLTPTSAGATSAMLTASASPGGDVIRTIAGNAIAPGTVKITEVGFDYGNIAVDATAPTTHTFSIINNGAAQIPTPVPAISGGAASYFVDSTNCNAPLDPGGAGCSVTVRFNPSTVGAKPGSLTVTSSPTNQGVATLSGTGVANVAVTKAGTGTGHVTSSPTGIDCATTCQGLTFDFAMTPVALTATADLGSTFVGWTGDCTGLTCSLDLTAKKKVTATFSAITPTLTLTKTGTGSGHVASNDLPATIDCGALCSHSYPYNTSITLTATAALGSKFTGWGGACAPSGTSPCTLAMTAAQDVTANFDSVSPVLTVIVAGGGTGTVTGQGITCGTGGASCTQTYGFGASVTLTAKPDVGMQFTSWTGDVPATCTTGTTCTLTIDQARNVTATFDKLSPSLLVVIVGTGAVTSSEVPPTISCGGGGTTCSSSYAYAQTVTLSATPAAGWLFGSWGGTGAGTCAGSTTTSCTVTMDQARSVTATFTAFTPTLQLTTNGTGTGKTTVAPSPASSSCGTGCLSYTYNYNDAVTMTAAPDPLSVFTGWSGDIDACPPTQLTCIVTMSKARRVTATYDLTTPTLNVSVTGNGHGSVVQTAPATPLISCAVGNVGTCTNTYPAGTMVTLLATASADSTFDGFGGVCATNPCTVTVDQGRTVSAGFTLKHGLLTVQTTGAGPGGVTSSPAGIACNTLGGGSTSGTCAADFPYAGGVAQAVSVTATPVGNTTFTGWTMGAGTCLGTTTPCTVSMDQAYTLVASFTPGLQDLALTVQGAGIVQSVAGINQVCATGSCAQTYKETYNATIMLVASSNLGSAFSGWTGCPMAVGATCTVPMTQTQAVTATFDQLLILTTTAPGMATGAVTTSLGGLTCAAGTSCMMTFAYNTSLSATGVPGGPTDGFGWATAPCIGAATCAVTMTGPVSLNGAFTPLTRTITITPAGNGTGTVKSDLAGLSCNSAAPATGCSAAFAYNATVKLTATPAADGSTFSSWTGDVPAACLNTATPTCTVPVDMARSITAAFAPGPQLLTVALQGDGTGTISSVQAPLASNPWSCSATSCTAGFTYGTSVDLIATASTNPSSYFSTWSSSFATCAGATCTGIVMNGPQTAHATFIANTQPLNLTKVGTGAMAATVSDGGALSCGVGCTAKTASYIIGTVVVLTATPGAGDTFGGWGGACGGVATTCSVTMSATKDVSATFVAGDRKLTVVSTPASVGGTVSAGSTPAPLTGSTLNCGSCTATYASGSTVTLTASPAPSWTFAGFTGCTSSVGTTCTVAMTADLAVTAAFNPQLAVNVAGSGTVASTTPAGLISCATGNTGTCSATATYGSAVTLTATPDAGGVFTGWTGAAGCTSATTCVVSMTAAQSVTATFNYPLGVSIVGPGSVTGGGISCPGTCSANEAAGANVSLSATPTAGAVFIGWSGGCTGSGSCTVAMTGAQSVTATFGYALAVAVTGPGTVTGGGINCTTGSTGTCSVNEPTTPAITLVATPNAGAALRAWGGACSGAGACTVTMSAAKSVTADFGFTLSMAASGGTITATAAGQPTVTCSAAGCAAVYPPNTSVTLTASPTLGTLSGPGVWSWGGACAGTAGSVCTLSMSSAQSVTLTYYTLSATTTGNGTLAGTSGAAPALSCAANSSCSQAYGANTIVTLTATPTAGNAIASWGGACATTPTTSTTCAVTMTAAQSVTVAFGGTSKLTVTTSGPGAVSTATGDTSGALIGCGNGGTTCSGTYLSTTTLTLAATPTAGAVFVGWSGACMGTGTCLVAMTAAQSVAASFGYKFDVTVVGSGSVTAPSIACSTGTCSANEAASLASVTLVAAPTNAGFLFAGWTGAGAGSCLGSTVATCTLPVDMARAVTATFTAFQPQLKITVNGTGTGTATPGVTPSYTSCGTGCYTYAYNDSVTLTATKGGLSNFTGWLGDIGTCSATATTCVVTMTQARNITATFDLTTPTLSVAAAPGATGNGTIAQTLPATPAIACTLTATTATGTCANSYTAGTSVTLVASPNADSTFTGWTGCTSVVGATCSVTVTTGVTVTPTFAIKKSTLTVTAAGASNGTISSSPAGISCVSTAGVLVPSPCTADFAYSLGLPQSVTITATPAANTTVSWGGTGSATCAAGATTCTISMNQAYGLTVTFTPGQQDLNLTINGAGQVSVGGVNQPCATGVCTSTSKQAYQATIPLIPSPNAGSVFHGWAGCTTVVGSTCNVTMDQLAAKSVTATFDQQLTVTTTTTGAAVGVATATAAGAMTPLVNCAQGTTCTATFPFGTMVFLASTGVGATDAFAWSAPAVCAGVGSCVVALTGPVTANGGFVPVTRLLSVVPGGTGNGTVKSDLAGINCSSASPGVNCSAQFAYNGTVMLTATAAADGSNFAGWSGTVPAACTVGAPATCAVPIDGAKTVTATFNAGAQTFTVTLAGNGAGAISSTPATTWTCVATTCTASFAYNQSVTVTATPSSNPSSTFGGWSAGPAGCSGGTCTAIVMNGARSATATFNANPQPLTVSKSGTGASYGTVSDGGTLSCGAACSQSYPIGTVVSLTATPGTGDSFDKWTTGPCAGLATNPCPVAMSQAQAVGAQFTAGMRTVRATVSGGGSVSAATGISACTATTGVCTAAYADASAVTLTPTASTGYTFAGWVVKNHVSGATLALCAGTTPCAIASLTYDADVTATFSVNSYVISLTHDANGTLTTSIGDSCGASCAPSYNYGTAVMVVANPNTGYTFTKWNAGPCAGSTASTCGFSVSGATTLTALYTINTYAIGVSPTPANGTVTGAGLTCGTGGATCSVSATYSATTPIVLTATPATGYAFGAWSGCPTPSGNTCSFYPTGPVTVGASFTINSYTLTVNPPISGTITSTDSTISCPGTCSRTAPYNTPITLTANPATGYSPTTWGGSCSGAASTSCGLTFNNTLSASAGFAANTYSIGVTVANSPVGGALGGNVAGTGINCGSGGTTCSTSYVYGAAGPLTLTATPITGWQFVGWGGACSGAGSCSVPFGAASSSVSATFSIATYSYTAVVGANGTVSTSVADSHFPCAAGATCTSQTLNYGTAVTLTAAPNAGYVFSSWTAGPCAGSTTTTCAFTITGPVTATAAFKPGLYALNLVVVSSASRPGDGTGTLTTNFGAFACTAATCTAQVPYGTSVTITGSPGSNMTFDGFTGGCVGAGPCTLVMPASAVTVNGSFSRMYYTMSFVGSSNQTTPTTPTFGGGTLQPGVPAPSCTYLAGNPYKTCTATSSYAVGSSMTITVKYNQVGDPTGNAVCRTGTSWANCAVVTSTCNNPPTDILAHSCIDVCTVGLTADQAPSVTIDTCMW